MALIGWMGAIVLTWGLFFLLIVGNGLLIRLLFGSPARSWEGLLLSFWIGWASLLMILQIWHLALPLDTRVFILLLITSGIGWALQFRQTGWRIVHLQWSGRATVLYAAVSLVVIILWTANRAMAEPTNYDTGLYHHQVVKWITTYPVVPGLVNFYGPYGLSISTYLYQGLFDISIWSGQAYHVANSLLLIAVWFQALHSTYQLRRDITRPAPHHLFNVLLIPILFYYTLSVNAISNFSTDIPVQLGSFVLTSLTLRFFSRHTTEIESPDLLFFAQALLIAALVTAKLSFAMYGLVLGLILLYFWYNRITESRRVYTLLWCAAWGVLLLAPWMARSVVMTGYPLYPNTIFAQDVEWREPIAEAFNRVEFVQATSRGTTGQPELNENFAWVSAWAQAILRKWFDFWLPMGIAAGAILLHFLNRNREQSSGLRWTLILPIPVAIIFWFFSAPDFRYITQYLWIFAYLCLLISLYELKAHLWRLRFGVIVGISTLLMAYLLVLVIRVEDYHLLPAHPEYGIYPMRDVELEQVEVNDTLTVWKPVHGDQCWDAPLPCAPDIHADLILKDPADYSKGFLRSEVVKAYSESHTDP